MVGRPVLRARERQQRRDLVRRGARAAVEHVAGMEIPVQQHRDAAVGDQRSRERVTAAEPVGGNRARHRLVAPSVSLDPVLEPAVT
jgi:hypothetical protein